MLWRICLFLAPKCNVVCLSPIVADSMPTSVYRGAYNECNKCTRLTVRTINLPRRSRRRRHHRHRVASYAGIGIGDFVGVSRLTCCGCLILLSVRLSVCLPHLTRLPDLCLVGTSLSLLSAICDFYFAPRCCSAIFLVVLLNASLIQ